MNREDVVRMAIDAIGGDMNGQDAQHLAWRLEHFKDDSYEFGPDALLKFVSLVAAATLKNSVMTDEEYEQAMADEGQRRMLSFDNDVRALIKEAVEAEREACLNCYSPDDTATDWADKIRARGQE